MKKKYIIMILIFVISGVGAFIWSQIPATSVDKDDEKQQLQTEEPTENQMDAKILEIQEDYILVEATEGQTIVGEVLVKTGLLSKDEIPDMKEGDIVRITHDGKMTMSLPPQMSAVEPIKVIKPSI